MAMAIQTEAATDTATGKGVVLFDGDCAFCQRSVAILRKLDWFHRLHFQSARDLSAIPENRANLDAEKMLLEMHVLLPDRQRSYAGFKAFRWMAGRLPALWLAWPFLYIPGVPFIGQKIYLWVAKNRFQLVPCHDGQCALPPRRR
jgi:predicted DCC family thiol-disulfide oxidoreductase YuxK